LKLYEKSDGTKSKTVKDRVKWWEKNLRFLPLSKRGERITLSLLHNPETAEGELDQIEKWVKGYQKAKRRKNEW